ncbi:GerMN domain-containing protein [Kineococcus radiotolerans]|uniref:GerMN domain-containing protein n=1 Tax=Kineococcus radiotolerans (strain ATCC BAA-149 / DSM 14245 / SRS30216) TaxID=266940 RepID=A6W9V6_KINRD|nr:GerMN domain-containing protein [Kineococcus radiotolerans]ABS03595.1 conserved hypothetical protein [Kineococcus radiotolerans SRS30216 = ATCC BAA-149]
MRPKLGPLAEPRALGVRAAVLAAVCSLVLASVSACSTPAGDEVRVVAPSEVPHGLLDPATSSPEPAVTGTAPLGAGPLVYFLTVDAALVAVPLGGEESAGEGGDPLTLVLRRLTRGPEEGERARGLASAVGPDVTLGVESLQDGTARIVVGELGLNLAADRLPLAVGQIVLSVAAVPGVQSVQLVRAGEVLEVPLPSGERSSEPLTAADYAPLLESR